MLSREKRERERERANAVYALMALYSRWTAGLTAHEAPVNDPTPNSIGIILERYTERANGPTAFSVVEC